MKSKSNKDIVERYRFKYNDGGRKAAGCRGKRSDCVCAAVSIALNIPYPFTYRMLAILGKWAGQHPRTGIALWLTERMTGWKYKAYCGAPLKGRYILRVEIGARRTLHCAAIIDGVIHDTCDFRKEEYRVRGYLYDPKGKSYVR